MLSICVSTLISSSTQANSICGGRNGSLDAIGSAKLIAKRFDLAFGRTRLIKWA
jgi:hypothetical protein